MLPGTSKSFERARSGSASANGGPRPPAVALEWATQPADTDGDASDTSARSVPEFPRSVPEFQAIRLGVFFFWRGRGGVFFGGAYQMSGTPWLVWIGGLGVEALVLAEGTQETIP